MIKRRNSSMKTTYNNFKQILKKTQTIKTGINRKSYQKEYGKKPPKNRLQLDCISRQTTLKHQKYHAIHIKSMCFLF